MWPRFPRALDGRTIYTYVTLAVADVLTGWLPEPRVVIKPLGGRAGDLDQRVAGHTAFSRGEPAGEGVAVRRTTPGFSPRVTVA